MADRTSRRRDDDDARVRASTRVAMGDRDAARAFVTYLYRHVREKNGALTRDASEKLRARDSAAGFRLGGGERWASAIVEARAFEDERASARG